MEAWCRNQDLEWEGELLQSSELLFTDLHAAIQTLAPAVYINCYYKLLQFVQFLC